METKNNILLQDIQQVVRSVDLRELKNSSIFVTGATGLLGSFIIRVLLYLNKTENYNVQIFALIRNKERFVYLPIVKRRLFEKINLSFGVLRR